MSKGIIISFEIIQIDKHNTKIMLHVALFNLPDNFPDVLIESLPVENSCQLIGYCRFIQCSIHFIELLICIETIQCILYLPEQKLINPHITLI